MVGAISASRLPPALRLAEPAGSDRLCASDRRALLRRLVPQVATPLIEFPVDTARTIASLLWSGTLSASPNVRFVFSHGGGALPMVMERVVAMGFVDRSLLAKVPEGAPVALAKLYVDTASVTGAPAMAALMKWLPEGHILYGTDFPWGALANSRAALARLGLPPERLGAIESRNASTLLNL